MEKENKSKLENGQGIINRQSFQLLKLEIKKGFQPQTITESPKLLTNCYQVAHHELESELAFVSTEWLPVTIQNRVSYGKKQTKFSNDFLEVFRCFHFLQEKYLLSLYRTAIVLLIRSGNKENEERAFKLFPGYVSSKLELSGCEFNEYMMHHINKTSLLYNFATKYKYEIPAYFAARMKIIIERELDNPSFLKTA